jgi:hypothetical protein
MPDDRREEFVVPVGVSVQVSGEKASRQIKSLLRLRAQSYRPATPMEKPAPKIALGLHLRTPFAMVERVSDSRYGNHRRDIER